MRCSASRHLVDSDGCAYGPGLLRKGEPTERRALIATLVKEPVVVSGNALMRYTIPMPEDGRTSGGNAERMALNGSVLSTAKNGGR